MNQKSKQYQLHYYLYPKINSLVHNCVETNFYALIPENTKVWNLLNSDLGQNNPV